MVRIKAGICGRAPVLHGLSGLKLFEEFHLRGRFLSRIDATILVSLPFLMRKIPSVGSSTCVLCEKAAPKKRGKCPVFGSF